MDTTKTSDMTYSDYLMLDQVLSAQNRLSDTHDEMLFIIIHQVTELWMKQVLFELQLAQDHIENDEPGAAHKPLSRVSRIQTIMTLAWDVLSTMTPSDYLTFRDKLGTSSGFQSAQFRELEYRLGLRQASYLKSHNGETLAHLKQVLGTPSLYDAALAAMKRAGLNVPQAVLDRDLGTAYTPNDDVEAVWLEVYKNNEDHWVFYQLAEKLVDLEDAFITWRFKHATTVERIIGRKKGTGGSDGVGYLQSTVQKRCFPELWSVRTRL